MTSLDILYTLEGGGRGGGGGERKKHCALVYISKPIFKLFIHSLGSDGILD